MRSSSSDRSIAPAPSQAARLNYARLRAPLGDGSRIAVRPIGAEQTTATAGTLPEPRDTLTLAIGWQRTAREHFRRGLPAAIELEVAIATVEDAIKPVLPLIGSGTALYTNDAIVREIVRASELPAVPELALPLDAVERTFARLATVAHGSPASVQGIPDRADFAATLLILREVMHHAQQRSTVVTVRPAMVGVRPPHRCGRQLAHRRRRAAGEPAAPGQPCIVLCCPFGTKRRWLSRSRWRSCCGLQWLLLLGTSADPALGPHLANSSANSSN